MSAALRTAILISGRGSNMGAIARAAQAGGIPLEVAIVIADRADAAGLATAQALGVPTTTVPRSDGGRFEGNLAACLERYAPEAIALAGFMRILSAQFVARYLGRLFNIHPSLLPAYRGLHTHRRVLAAHEAVHGASVHYVTPELDAGPIILQSRVAVRPGDTEAQLAARVLRTEHVIYPRVLGWVAQRRLKWQDGGAWLDGTRLDQPIVEDFSAADT